MARDVEPAKTARALRKLRKTIALAEAEGRELSAWEREFAASLETRLETYGSAFRDRSKGGEGEALSRLQTQKLSELSRKAKTGASPRPARKALRRAKRRHRADDAETALNAELDAPDETRAAPTPAPRPAGRQVLRVIEGGRDREEG